LKAWERIGPRLPLTIFGDGPLRNEVASTAKASNGGITWLGWRSRSEIDAALGAASVTICPSIWVEAGTLSVIESFARGTPVVASRLGSLAEFVESGRSGYLFEPGNSAALVEAIENFLKLPDSGLKMGANAREVFLKTYSADLANDNLLDLYSFALRRFRSSKIRS
jgi:glycosyltransferase involved in cell wall biosynthesis